MRQRNKNSLFLMELMMDILFFAISAAICLQMFAYASQTAAATQSLRNATLAARSAGACYQSAAGDLNHVAQLLSGSAQGDVLQVGYDRQWQTTTDAPLYQLTLTRQGAAADIVVTDGKQTIYTLTVHIPGGAP